MPPAAQSSWSGRTRPGAESQERTAPLRAGFTSVEIFRKFLWYLLRERAFKQDVVDDLLALKKGLGLTDSEVGARGTGLGGGVGGTLQATSPAGANKPVGSQPRMSRSQCSRVPAARGEGVVCVCVWGGDRASPLLLC